MYALDTTTIDLSLKVFPWAHFRTTKAAVKMHTQIDLRGNIPSFIHVSDGKMHEVNVLDLMTPEGGSFTIMDRGFLDFARVYRLTQAGAFFVIRPKSNTAFQRVYSRSVDKTTGLRCDQTVRLTGVTSANDYPQYLRCVVVYIPRSRHDPKILWVDDAEIVGDRITKVRPIPRNLSTQKTERRIGELGASCVALVVSDVSVHEAP